MSDKESETKDSNVQDEEKSPSKHKHSAVKTRRNYYIPDDIAVSDEEIELPQKRQPKARSFKESNYIDYLTEEAETSSYNKELLDHIRKTQQREQKRKEQLSLGQSGFDGDFSAPRVGALEENKGYEVGGFREFSYPQAGVNIRYKHDGSVVDEQEDYKTEKLLPSESDPKLWKVGCTVGKERECVFDLMSYYKRKKSEEDPPILSAFTSDLCKGYIYVEAFKKEDVSTATTLVNSLYRYRITYVPLNEMTETLESGKLSQNVKVGSWVRVNRGIYKNDIAQVQNVFDDGFKVEIKLVPRIDLSKVKRSLMASVAKDADGSGPKNAKKAPYGELDSLIDTEDSKKGSKQLKQTKSEKTRANANRKPKVPPARFFDEAEIKRILEQVVDPERVEELFRHVRGDVFFMNRKYSDGYLFLKSSVSSLITNITPTEKEITKFDNGKNSFGALSEKPISINPAESQTPDSNRKSKFRFKDRVRVIAGDLANLTGVVTSIRSGKVYIMPDHKDLNEPLGFSFDELEKHFEVGEHIKVQSGPQENETGFITKVDEEHGTLLIFSDISNKIIEVPKSSAIETPGMTQGKNRIGIYSLLDFVQLECDICGVIVHVLENTLSVLNNKGIVQNVEVKDIMKKRYGRNVFALDKNNNQITTGDIVKVVDKTSPYSNITATIHNIYKTAVFLHNKEIRENCSIFVVPSKSLVVTGAPKEVKSKARDLQGNNNSMFTYSTRHKKNPWEGKYVTMTGGIYKGKRGIIKGVPNLEKCLVELLAENKIVTVRKSEVEESEDGSLMPDHSVKTPLIGAKTPKANYTPSYGAASEGYSGAKTPMYGSKTPMYGSKTPMYGSKTPMYGSKTPIYGNKTPTYGNKTPMYGNKTPIYGIKTPNYGNKTPVYENKTPIYGNRTPNYGNKTPVYETKTPRYGSDTPIYGKKTPRLDDSLQEYGSKTPVYGNKTPVYENRTSHRGFETPLDRKPHKNYERQGNRHSFRTEPFFKKEQDQREDFRSPNRFRENMRGNNKRFHRGSNSFRGRGNKRGRADGRRENLGGFREQRSRDEPFSSSSTSRFGNFNSPANRYSQSSRQALESQPLYYQAEGIGSGSWYSPPPDPRVAEERFEKPSMKRYNSPSMAAQPDSFARPQHRGNRGFDSRDKRQDRSYESRNSQRRPEGQQASVGRLVKEEDPFWGT